MIIAILDGGGSRVPLVRRALLSGTEPGRVTEQLVSVLGGGSSPRDGVAQEV